MKNMPLTPKTDFERTKSRQKWSKRTTNNMEEDMDIKEARIDVMTKTKFWLLLKEKVRLYLICQNK